jgi:transcriptional regulator with XRE-family HTH domain
MLSLIESGRAKPSMETLRYFAERLGRPLSWFLGEETMASPNQTVMEKTEAAFKSGNYADGLELLGSYRGPDPLFDEWRYYLEILCLLELAAQAVQQEKMPYARGLLERVAQAGMKTCYPWDRQRWLLLRHAAGESAQSIAPRLTGMKAQLQLLAQAALEAGDPSRAAEYLIAVDDRSPDWSLQMGTLLLKKKDFAAAAEMLLAAEEAYPLQCIPLLETCYRELGNFELAYKYACKARDAKTET